MTKLEIEISELCGNVRFKQVGLQVAIDELDNIEDHGELANAEAFVEHTKHELRSEIRRLQSLLTQYPEG